MTDLAGGAEHEKLHRETSRSRTEMARQFCAHRLPAILVRQQRLSLLDRPGDGKGGVVPPKPPVMLGRIVAVHLVDDLGIGLERAEPVGKSLGNKELVAFLGAEHEPDMMPVGWRAVPEIDRDIEDRTGRDAHQLCLWLRRDLKMQAAYNAAISREREVFLDERPRDPVLPQQILPEDLGEKPARVKPANRLYLLYVRNRGGADLHRVTSFKCASKAQPSKGRCFYNPPAA